MKNLKHIGVAGNIGAGKTTLTQKLAAHFGWTARLEEADNNPVIAEYLKDFYEDMSRWSFEVQVLFLSERLNQIDEIQQGEDVVIQDRTIYEDAKIFAPNLHDIGMMSDRSFNNYQALFGRMTKRISPPDLLIYLRADVETLMAQIKKRGRKEEQTIEKEYIKRLNAKYESWISTYKGNILILNVEDNNYADNIEDLLRVVEIVEEALP